MRFEDEIEQLRGFSLAVIDHLGWGVPSEALEPLRSTRSVRGLRDAARDMVEMCQDLGPDQVAALDTRLARVGLPTLTLMRDRRYRELLEVLSRGRIRSDEEFRLVNGFVSELDTPDLSLSARHAAEALMRAFEFER